MLGCMCWATYRHRATCRATYRATYQATYRATYRAIYRAIYRATYRATCLATSLSGSSCNDLLHNNNNKKTTYNYDMFGGYNHNTALLERVLLYYYRFALLNDIMIARHWSTLQWLLMYSPRHWIRSSYSCQGVVTVLSRCCQGVVTVLSRTTTVNKLSIMRQSYSV